MPDIYNRNPRYAYIKNGDVVTQLEQLVATDWLVPEGGPNAFIANFLHAINGSPVLLISSNKRNASKMEGGITAYVFDVAKHRNSPFRKVLLGARALTKTMLRLLRFKPQRILCGQTGYMLWVCYVVSEIYAVPLVHARHNRVEVGGTRSLYHRVRYRLDVWVIKQAHAVVCHGPYLRQQLMDVGVMADRVFEFDSGNRDFYQRAGSSNRPPEIPNNPADVLILYVGRVQDNKGIFDLFEATKSALEGNQRLKLVYIGGGDALQRLVDTVNDAGLDKQVLILGAIDHGRLGAYMNCCSLLVAPTRSSFPEGRCMSVMEGLVLGLPIIVPEFGPFPYLIQDGVNGLLFEPDSVDDLRSCIERVLDNTVLYDQLRIGAAISGACLLDAPVSFADAVDCAYSRPVEG